MRTRLCLTICLAALLAVPATAFAEESEEEVGEMTGETATAQTTAGTKETCREPAMSTPLAKLGDPRHYFTAPGGRFEDRGRLGWRLAGNAQYNNPSNPFRTLGRYDRESLRLQPGGSATSPAFCVDLDYPSFRFFLADLEVGEEEDEDEGANGTPGELDVEVIYPELSQDNVFLAARMTAGKSWKLSPDVMLEPERAGATFGWRKVAIRFTARGHNADFRIDDLVVDPRMRG